LICRFSLLRDESTAHGSRHLHIGLVAQQSLEQVLVVYTRRGLSARCQAT
jgi:hypothetical protein